MKFYILVAYEYICILSMKYCLKSEITKKKKSRRSVILKFCMTDEFSKTDFFKQIQRRAVMMMMMILVSFCNIGLCTHCEEWRVRPQWIKWYDHLRMVQYAKIRIRINVTLWVYYQSCSRFDPWYKQELLSARMCASLILNWIYTVWYELPLL